MMGIGRCLMLPFPALVTGMNPSANNEKRPQALASWQPSRCGGFSLLGGEFIRLILSIRPTP